MALFQYMTAGIGNGYTTGNNIDRKEDSFMYHYNQKTGKISQCKAKSPATCPFGEENHAVTIEEAQKIADKKNSKRALSDNLITLKSDKEFSHIEYPSLAELKSFRKIKGLTEKDKQYIVDNLEQLKKEVKNEYFYSQIDEVINKVSAKNTDGFRVVNLDTCCNMPDGRPAYNLDSIARKASSKGNSEYSPEDIVLSDLAIPDTACITPTKDKDIYEYRDSPDSNKVTKVKIDSRISAALSDVEFVKELKRGIFSRMRAEIQADKIFTNERAEYPGVDLLIPNSNGELPDYATEPEAYRKQLYIFNIIKK